MPGQLQLVPVLSIEPAEYNYYGGDGLVILSPTSPTSSEGFDASPRTPESPTTNFSDSTGTSPALSPPLPTLAPIQPLSIHKRPGHTRAAASADLSRRNAVSNKTKKGGSLRRNRPVAEREMTFLTDVSDGEYDPDDENAELFARAAELLRLRAAASQEAQRAGRVSLRRSQMMTHSHSPSSAGQHA